MIDRRNWQTYLIVGATVAAVIIVIGIIILGSLQTARESAPAPDNGGSTTQLSPQPIIPESLPKLVINPAPALTINNQIKYSFSLPDSTVVTAVPVYKIYGLPVSQNAAQSWANNFGLSGSPAVQNGLLTWSDGNGNNLVVNVAQGFFNFAQTILPSKPDSPGQATTLLSSTEDAIHLASDFLKQHHFISNDLDTLPATSFQSGDETPLTDNNFESANGIGLTYARVLSGRQVYYQYGQTTSVQMLITKFGTIGNFYYRMPLVSASTNLFSVKSLSQAQAEINNGQGVIVKYTPVDGIFNAYNPVSINLSGLVLGFLDDGRSGYLIPIYVFSGEALNSAGVKKQVVVYLPAIKQ